MIITRTPLRISIGGGGTDLPSYYTRFGGFVVSAAISQYVFVSLNRMFREGYLLKYSSLEHVGRVDEIQHPIFREVLRRHNGHASLEVDSMADVPAGTGLGSSGTFTVGLLKALFADKHEFISAAALAEEACDIEINVLGRAVGKQDQYIAAFGGLTCFDFHTDGTIDVKPLAISNETLIDLQQNLLMFFTGYSRNAIEVLSDQKQRSLVNDQTILENLHHTKELGIAAKEALERGDTARFAAIMREHWENKRERSKGMSNDCIDHWYKVAMANGALGGKLVGAGGGGYLLFYAEHPMQLRRAMAQEGLRELNFRFDHDGSAVLFRD
jgi:D-glycero-alpha-D-manno-heptose-7-phosphate kinase